MVYSDGLLIHYFHNDTTDYWHPGLTSMQLTRPELAALTAAISAQYWEQPLKSYIDPLNDGRTGGGIFGINDANGTTLYLGLPGISRVIEA